jgi:antibiotic biosynthesis monooxygenase (ABM) superfamily enzyme
MALHNQEDDDKYEIVRPSLKEVLDYVELFETKIQKFIKKYPGCKYDVGIVKNDGDEWCAKIKIRYEQDNSKAFEETADPFDIL